MLTKNGGDRVFDIRSTILDYLDFYECKSILPIFESIHDIVVVVLLQRRRRVSYLKFDAR